MQTAKKKLYPLEIALMIGLAAAMISGVVSLQRQDALAEKVVRLHVLANSDSAEDQALKLKVRDAVLTRAEEILAEAKSRSAAENSLRGALPELESLAKKTVHDNGYSYSVTAELSNTEFPSKKYTGFALPAGEYLALRILIGEAKGQNWWCVVFPPLCTAVSSDLSETAFAAGLNKEDIRLITEETEEYVLKFKMVELWETLRQKFQR